MKNYVMMGALSLLVLAASCLSDDHNKILNETRMITPVSYTHLTLPTNSLV